LEDDAIKKCKVYVEEVDKYPGKHKNSDAIQDEILKHYAEVKERNKALIGQ